MELSLKILDKLYDKVEKGYWYTPRYPIRYKKVRVYCFEECASEDCKNCEMTYHYEKEPTAWRKGKGKFEPPANPKLFILKDMDTK